MSTVLDDLIMQRIAFLKELIKPGNRPEVNDTFRLQVEILQTADIEMLDKSISMRRLHLKQANAKEVDRLFCELDALEWLQRQKNRQ